MRNKSKVINILLAAALISSAMVFTACESSTSAQPEKAAEASEAKAEKRHGIRVEVAFYGDVEEVISRATTIKAPESVELIPRTSGQLEELRVEEGSYVKAGEVVARINADSQKLAVERAEAALSKAGHDLELALKQLEAKVLDKEAFLQAKHNFEQAGRDCRKAEIELAKTVVTSPISGVISKRHVSRGDTVFPSTSIVTITDNTRLEADILVPQNQVGRVAIGNKVVFAPNGDSDRVFFGVVDRISPVVSIESGTVKIVARVLPGQGNVLPGQFIKAGIITGIQKDVVLVPSNAITFENAMGVIYKVEDGFARRIPVEIGYAGTQGVRVIGDVASGDQVIVSGLVGLADMSRVEILPALEKVIEQ